MPDTLRVTLPISFELTEESLENVLDFAVDVSGTFVAEVALADVNGDAQIDANDVDLLASLVRRGDYNGLLDLNADGRNEIVVTGYTDNVAYVYEREP